MPLDGCAVPTPDHGLSDTARGRIDAAKAEVRALLALGTLANLLDPACERTRWSIASDIAARLRAFEIRAWPRIRSGGREPRDTLETLLGALLSSPRTPRDPRRLWDLLANRN